jgi:prophage regulatory protein
MSEQLSHYLQEAEKRPSAAPRLLNAEDLRALGIRYSRMHLRRLILAGSFPAPISLGENRRAWVADEIHDWIDGRIRERDAGTAAA